MKMHLTRMLVKGLLVCWVIIPLAGCQEPPPPPVETIRAIKTITVTERATGQIRKFSGLVEAADTSMISFEVSGVTQEIRVKAGDKVKKGQVIATLDQQKFQLNVQAAAAEVDKVKVLIRDKKNELDRLLRIFKIDPGAVSARSIDQAQAAYDGSQQSLDYAQSQLNLAKRDLRNTKLIAPFDGVIAEKFVDPFQEVKRGQRIFSLFSEGTMEVAVQIPETVIQDIYFGLAAEIRFPTDPDRVFKGIVSEVSSVAGKANAFPIKVTISEPNEKIRPGMTAEVALLLSESTADSSYLIPLAAVAPGGDTEAKAYIFVFDPESSTVKKTAVDGGGVRDNTVVVTQGIQAGDIIAIAGVSFLRDGQKVKLMAP